MGSALDDRMIRWLISIGVIHVVLALDSDYAEIADADFDEFEKKVLKIVDKLTPYFTVDLLYNNVGYEGCYKFSPTDYTRKQYDVLWKNKERMN